MLGSLQVVVDKKGNYSKDNRNFGKDKKEGFNKDKKQNFNKDNKPFNKDH